MSLKAEARVRSMVTSEIPRNSSAMAALDRVSRTVAKGLHAVLACAWISALHSFLAREHRVRLDVNSLEIPHEGHVVTLVFMPPAELPCKPS